MFRILDTSSMVHLHSSLLFAPDHFMQSFPLSVQYPMITHLAPRGGLDTTPVSRSDGPTIIFSIVCIEINSFASQHN